MTSTAGSRASRSVARPIGQFRRAWRWCGRNRVVAVPVGERGRAPANCRGCGHALAVRQHALRVAAETSAAEATVAADSEREARHLADARAGEIRWRLVRMNVENGNRISDEGDLTGALPWFAEALRLDRDDPAAAATHRLRLGTLLKQSPVLDAIFSHEGHGHLGCPRPGRPAARHGLGGPHGQDLGRRAPAAPSRLPCCTKHRSTGSSFKAMVPGS